MLQLGCVSCTQIRPCHFMPPWSPLTESLGKNQVSAVYIGLPLSSWCLPVGVPRWLFIRSPATDTNEHRRLRSADALMLLIPSTPHYFAFITWWSWISGQSGACSPRLEPSAVVYQTCTVDISIFCRQLKLFCLRSWHFHQSLNFTNFVLHLFLFLCLFLNNAKYSRKFL